MNDAQDFVFDIALRAEKIDQASEFARSQLHCQRIDREIAAKQVHFDGRKLHSGQRCWIFIVFQAGGGHIDMLVSRFHAHP